MAAGGVRASNAASLLQRTGVRELHTSARRCGLLWYVVTQQRYVYCGAALLCSDVPRFSVMPGGRPERARQGP